MTVACNAKKKSGGRCKNPGTGTGGRCKFHGGATPVGPAAPSWKHGRHSKYLPSGLAAKYHDALNDPELTSLRSELALVDGRVSELLEALGETGNVRLWKEARAKLDAIQATGKKRVNAAQAQSLMTELDALLTRGLSHAATWDELYAALDLRRRTSESETRRLKDLQQLVPVNQMFSFLSVFMTEVKVVVKDPAVLTRLSAFLSQLVGQPGGGHVGA